MRAGRPGIGYGLHKANYDVHFVTPFLLADRGTIRRVSVGEKNATERPQRLLGEMSDREAAIEEALLKSSKQKKLE